MKLQMIYSFYVKDDKCNDGIYNLHYKMINIYSNIFDKIIFVILHNGDKEDDIIYRVKAKLLSICNCNNIQIIYEQNNPKFREGIVFKKYIIDKLDSYDDYLTFFAHTKGLTNKNGLANLENLYKWIFFMYALNLCWIDEVKSKLSYNTIGKPKISYGGLFFKDYRHNNIHNWFYSGSFHWINTHKLRDHILKNNIDISKFLNEDDESLKRCAELFIGCCIDTDLAAFRYDERYNKNSELFHMYGWEISYNNIDLLIKAYLNIYDYQRLEDYYIKIKEELSI